MTGWDHFRLPDGRCVLVTTGTRYQAVRVFRGAPKRGDYVELLTHFIPNPKKFIRHAHEVMRYATLRDFLMLGVKPRQKP